MPSAVRVIEPVRFHELTDCRAFVPPRAFSACFSIFDGDWANTPTEKIETIKNNMKAFIDIKKFRRHTLIRPLLLTVLAQIFRCRRQQEQPDQVKYNGEKLNITRSGRKPWQIEKPRKGLLRRVFDN